VAARLVWTSPEGNATEFALLKPVMTVGREADSDVRVNEPLVSRAHARLERRDDVWFVVDLGSTNLTRVNGEAVVEQRLKDGDEVRFARARCQFFGEAGLAASSASS
jgi:pSer/pThr/pTyr-binding forkhead associated (FHA) protein